MSVEDTLTRSVSTAFPAGAHKDLVLQSSDAVAFHVDYDRLAEASANHFGGILRGPGASSRPITVGETAGVLNIILHALYDLPSVQFQPSFATVQMAVEHMQWYGLAASTLVQPGKCVYELLYSFAPRQPMDVYMLASRYELNDLAVKVSPHLLSFEMSGITDEMADGMGARFLMRLMFLHLDRLAALKEILMAPMVSHPGACSAPGESQRAWALASASVVTDTKACRWL